jgi:predicted O-methyltransferase YrrM
MDVMDVLWRVPTPVLRFAAPLVLRRPVSGLAVARLYAYLDELLRTKDVEGAVVEIGVHLAGTSAIAHRFLQQIHVERRYVGIDTFSGFVRAQFEVDVALGVPADHSRFFSQNSIELVRRLVTLYGCEEIELIEGDVCTMTGDELPSSIAVALVDVDLTLPIRASLDLLYPRMSSGGVILIDDCAEVTSWAGARPEYLRWVSEHGLEPEFKFGFGRILVP